MEESAGVIECSRRVAERTKAPEVEPGPGYRLQLDKDLDPGSGECSSQTSQSPFVDLL